MWSESDSDTYVPPENFYEEVDELKRYREEKRKLEEQMTIIRRTKFFEDLHFQLIGKRDSILHLSGVNFTRFNHEIIVFIFKPSSLPSILARDATEFKTVLKYNRNYWKVSSCSKGHLGIKQKFYQWSAQRNIQDAGIVQFIISLYNELVSWYTEHTKYLLGRQKLYRNGVEVYFDSEEEELLLTSEEIRMIHKKREAILQRMIVPEKRRKTFSRRR